KSETTASDVAYRSSRIGLRLSVNSFSLDPGRTPANRPAWRRGVSLPCRIVGQDGLRVCRRVPEICDQSGPYHPGLSAAFPRESVHVPDREPRRFCGRRREQYRRLMPCVRAIETVSAANLEIEKVRQLCGK